MGPERHLTYDTSTGQVYSVARLEDSSECRGVVEFHKVYLTWTWKFLNTPSVYFEISPVAKQNKNSFQIVE